MKLINENIQGEGKGGGSAPVEAPNTLRARQTAKSLVAICEGPIEGVQNIYFNDTDIDQFADCGYDTRNGDSTQTVIPLFTNVSSTVNVGLELIGPGGMLYGYITTATTSVINLLHPITLPSGVNKISVKLPNGKTETKTILTGAGTWSSISVSPFSVAPNDNSAYNIKLSTSTTHPIAQDVSSTSVDEVYINVQLDSLVAIDDNGNANGYTVKFLVETRNSPADVWTDLTTWVIKGKSTKPYSEGFSILRPDGAAGKIWGVRITRITKPDSSAKINSNSRWVNTNEITHKTLTYDNTALCGIYADAQSTGGSIPRVSLLVKGLKIKVPKNYNPETRVYTGAFNGTLTTGVFYTDNPAYCLLDLLSNERYGMGVPLSKIDIYSFYNAGVYCDQMVSYVNESGDTITEPRFTFNNIIQTYEDAYTLIQAIASCMRGFVIELGGLLTLIQDRQGSISHVFTNANVIDGIFEYNSNDLNERFTTVNVTYNDPNDRYLQKVITVPHSTDLTYDTEIEKYPYNSAEIAAVGCTSPGQAYRLGKYYIDNSLLTGENVQFKTSIQHAFVQPGDIILVSDSHYSGENLGGRIVSATTTSITLDRTITLSGGINSITAYLSDGTIETKTISQTNGSFTTITTTSPFSSTPAANSTYIVTLSTSSIPPRTFRISKVTLMTSNEGNLLEISASLYDATKYDRVDASVTMPIRQFTNIVQYAVPKPISITRKFIQNYDSVNNINKNHIFIDWEPGDSGIYTYKIKWSYENSDFIEVSDISATNFTIQDAEEGYYEVWLYAQNVHGAISEGVLIEFTYGYSDIEDSPAPLVDQNTILDPMIDFYVKGTTNNNFNDADLIVSWNDPNTITGQNQAVLSRYVIEVYDATYTTLHNTYYITPNNKEFSYTYLMNRNDYGSATRNVYMKLYGEDTNMRRSNANTKQFTNPVPVLTNWTVSPSFNSVYINIEPSLESDIKEYIIYRGTTSNFTKDDNAIIYSGVDTYINLETEAGIQYYYAFAIADTFGRLGINISTEQTATAVNVEPDLYTYTGLTFIANHNGPQLDPDVNYNLNSVYWTQFNVYKNGSVLNTVSSGSTDWTTGTLYLYYIPGDNTLNWSTSLVAAIAAGGRVLATYRGGTDLQHDEGKAFTSGDQILAGTLGANALVTNTAVITNAAQIGNVIESDGYDPITKQGWRIDKNGWASFNSIGIYDQLGNVVLEAGEKVIYDNVGGTKPPANATRNVYRGTWTNGLNIIVGDIVKDSIGTGWIAIQDHVSDVFNKPPTLPAESNAYWTIYIIASEDALTIINPNESHSFGATSTGVVSVYTSSGTTIDVYEGNEKILYDGIGTSPGTWKVTAVATNITTGTLTNSSGSLIVGDHSNFLQAQDVANIKYNITGTRLNGKSFTISTAQTFSKSKAGTAGADSTAYWLTTSAPAIQKSIGGVYTPSTVTYNLLAATGTNAPAAYSGRFIIATSTDGVNYTNQYTSSVNESTYTYTVPANIKTIRVRGYLAGGTTNLIDELITTIVTDGATGSSGINAISVVYTNEAHTVPVSSAGTETWTGSGGLLNVYDGTTLLTLDSNTQATTYPTTGRYRLNITAISGNTLTEPTITGSGTTTATLSAWAGDLTTVTVYRITAYVTTLLGTQITNSVDVTITPSFQGSTGLQGDTGPTVIITSDRTAVFTATDGTLNAGQSNIVFTATTYGITSPTYSWTFLRQDGNGTSPTISTSNTYTITSANFGTSNAVLVTCVVSGTYTDKMTINRLEKSTAAAGATVGAIIGTNLSGQLNSGNIGTFMADNTIPSAKITNLTADRISTGTLNAATQIYVGDLAAGDGILIDAPGRRIAVAKSNVERVRFGLLSDSSYGLQAWNSSASEVFRLNQNGLSFADAASTAFWPFGGGRYYKTLTEGSVTMGTAGTYTVNVDTFYTITGTDQFEVIVIGFTEKTTVTTRGAGNFKIVSIQGYSNASGTSSQQATIDSSTTDATNFPASKITVSIPSSGTLRIALTSRTSQGGTAGGETTGYKYIVRQFGSAQ